MDARGSNNNGNVNSNDYDNDESMFDDDIDWSSLPLPGDATTNTNGGGNDNGNGNGNGNANGDATSYPTAATPSVSISTSTTNANSNFSYTSTNVAVTNTHPHNTTTSNSNSNLNSNSNSISNSTITHLESIIASLQNQLSQRDARLCSLESSIVTIEAETSHTIRTAQQNAQREVHDAQAELRRLQHILDKKDRVIQSLSIKARANARTKANKSANSNGNGNGNIIAHAPPPLNGNGGVNGNGSNGNGNGNGRRYSTSNGVDVDAGVGVGGNSQMRNENGGSISDGNDPAASAAAVSGSISGSGAEDANSTVVNGNNRKRDRHEANSHSRSNSTTTTTTMPNHPKSPKAAIYANMNGNDNGDATRYIPNLIRNLQSTQWSIWYRYQMYERSLWMEQCKHELLRWEDWMEEEEREGPQERQGQMQKQREEEGGMNRYNRNHNACKNDGGNEKYGVNGMGIGMGIDPSVMDEHTEQHHFVETLLWSVLNQWNGTGHEHGHGHGNGHRSSSSAFDHVEISANQGINDDNGISNHSGSGSGSGSANDHVHGTVFNLDGNEQNCAPLTTIRKKQKKKDTKWYVTYLAKQLITGIVSASDKMMCRNENGDTSTDMDEGAGTGAGGEMNIDTDADKSNQNQGISSSSSSSSCSMALLYIALPLEALVQLCSLDRSARHTVRSWMIRGSTMDGGEGRKWNSRSKMRTDDSGARNMDMDMDVDVDDIDADVDGAIAITTTTTNMKQQTKNFTRIRGLPHKYQAQLKSRQTEKEQEKNLNASCPWNDEHDCQIVMQSFRDVLARCMFYNDTIGFDRTRDGSVEDGLYDEEEGELRQSRMRRKFHMDTWRHLQCKVLELCHVLVIDAPDSRQHKDLDMVRNDRDHDHDQNAKDFHGMEKVDSHVSGHGKNHQKMIWMVLWRWFLSSGSYSSREDGENVPMMTKDDNYGGYDDMISILEKSITWNMNETGRRHGLIQRRSMYHADDTVPQDDAMSTSQRNNATRKRNEKYNMEAYSPLKCPEGNNHSIHDHGMKQVLAYTLHVKSSVMDILSTVLFSSSDVMEAMGHPESMSNPRFQDDVSYMRRIVAAAVDDLHGFILPHVILSNPSRRRRGVGGGASSIGSRSKSTRRRDKNKADLLAPALLSASSSSPTLPTYILKFGTSMIHLLTTIATNNKGFILLRTGMQIAALPDERRKSGVLDGGVDSDSDDFDGASSGISVMIDVLYHSVLRLSCLTSMVEDPNFFTTKDDTGSSGGASHVDTAGQDDLLQSTWDMVAWVESIIAFFNAIFHKSNIICMQAGGKAHSRRRRHTASFPNIMQDTEIMQLFLSSCKMVMRLGIVDNGNYNHRQCLPTLGAPCRFQARAMLEALLECE